MFDLPTNLPLAGILFWAAIQGGVAQRIVAGVWRRSLPHELMAGAVVMLLSYIAWARDYASFAALALFGVTLLVNAAAVMIAHRFQPPEPPFRLR